MHQRQTAHISKRYSKNHEIHENIYDHQDVKQGKAQYTDNLTLLLQ